MAKKKFDYDKPIDGVEFYYVYAGEVRWDRYSVGFADSLIEDHNFFQTYDGASKACDKMKELFKAIQQEEEQ